MNKKTLKLMVAGAGRMRCQPGGVPRQNDLPSDRARDHERRQDRDHLHSRLAAFRRARERSSHRIATVACGGERNNTPALQISYGIAKKL